MRWLCRVLAVVFPWPPREERKARVAQARRAAEESRRKAEEAARLRRDLEEIVERNHFAQAILEGLIQRGRTGAS